MIERLYGKVEWKNTTALQSLFDFLYAFKCEKAIEL